MIASWLPSLAVRKWLPGVASSLRITASLIAAQAGERGGYWLLVAVLFSVLGLLSFALAGLTVFVLLRGVAE